MRSSGLDFMNVRTVDWSADGGSIVELLKTSLLNGNDTSHFIIGCRNMQGESNVGTNPQYRLSPSTYQYMNLQACCILTRIQISRLSTYRFIVCDNLSAEMIYQHLKYSISIQLYRQTFTSNIHRIISKILAHSIISTRPVYQCYPFLTLIPSFS